MRVDFYHLQTQTLEDVLPKLVEKAFESGAKIKIKIGTEERVEFINSLLWTYNDESFLPHGSKKDGNGEMQPIWLSSEDDIPNGATLLFLIDGASSQDINFERIIKIFSDSEAEDAREFWKELKSSGAEVFYWQQDNSGKWLKK